MARKGTAQVVTKGSKEIKAMGLLGDQSRLVGRWALVITEAEKTGVLRTLVEMLWFNQDDILSLISDTETESSGAGVMPD